MDEMATTSQFFFAANPTAQSDHLHIVTMRRSLLTSLAFSSSNMQRPILRGVVFDMDGTLTAPNLDFGEMYRRCGVDLSQDILEAVAKMPADQAQRATSIIEEMEEEGRRTLQLMPGALEMSYWLQAHQIPTAIVTRNTFKTCQVLNGLLPLKFDVVISRDMDHPPKPHPDALNAIAGRWNIDLPNDGILMVGDSPANDIVFGKTAGVRTALLDTGRRYMENSSGKSSEAADIVVDHLLNLPRQLWESFDIDGPLGSAATALHGQPVPEPTSLLTKAVANRDISSLEKLLADEQHRYAVNTPDESGNTPLIWAGDLGHLDIVDFLLGLDNINIDVRGYLGATALCRAARRGHVDVIQRLIEAGANMDIPNDKMQHPLHFAAFKENEEVVKILLECGANTRVLDRKGRTPAEDTKNERIRQIILEAMK